MINHDVNSEDKKHGIKGYMEIEMELVKTKSGRPALWEKGGGKTNTGPFRYVFADNQGKLYHYRLLSTSLDAFVRFLKRIDEIKTAIKKHLRRVGAGVYEKNKERREK